MTTRKYNTGALYQRTSDGRWIGRLPNGRGGYQYVTGTDREDVRKRLDQARRERDRTTSPTRGGQRLRDLMDAYLTDVAPVRLRPRTLEDHRQVNRDHITPVIGSIRVRQLEGRDVQRVVNTMTASGLSPKTISNAVHVLSGALRHAMRAGELERNVASLAVLPERRRERLPSLTTARLRQFLADTKGEPLWPVWVLCGTMGLRISEVLGLRWKDIDGDTLTVSGQYRRVDAGDRIVWQRVEPKTTKSRRTLHLPTLAREAIRVQRAQATSAVIVFARASGEGPMDRSWVTRRFADALTAHKLPSVRLHSLRHASAVAMLDATGGDLRAVSAVLGHSTIAVTVDTYGSEADAARKRAAEAMDRAMSDVTALREAAE